MRIQTQTSGFLIYQTPHPLLQSALLLIRITCKHPLSWRAAHTRGLKELTNSMWGLLAIEAWLQCFKPVKPVKSFTFLCTVCVLVSVLCNCEWQVMELSSSLWLAGPVPSPAGVTDTWEHSLLMRHNANQWYYLSQIICFQLQHITHRVISTLFISDFQHIVRKHSSEHHKSAQITLNLFLSVLVLLKDFLK